MGDEHVPRLARGGRLAALLLLLGAVVFYAAPRQAQHAPPPGQGAAPTYSDCLLRLHRPCLDPARARAIYGVGALLRRGLDGRGRTIAIVVSFGSPTISADLHAFDRAFGLPDPQLTVLAPLGPTDPGNSGWVGETSLDVEWAHAMAPGARLVVLESPVDETEGVQGLPEFLKLEQYAVAHHLADVISQSWAATENTLFDAAGRAIVARFHSFYAAAAAAGVTAVAASGDDGAGGPDLSVTHLFPYPVVGYPASDPFVLAVGGTRLLLRSNGTLSGETTWPGSGGGRSRFFAEPAYQRAQPVAVQRFLAGRRGLPDVALNAALESPVLIYVRGNWTVTGGTSASTPQWAGLIALADQLAGHDLGSVNAALYALAASSHYAADWRDITSGGIAAPRQDGLGVHGVAFQARPGWDAATGLGTPRATALVPDLAAQAGRTPSGLSH